MPSKSARQHDSAADIVPPVVPSSPWTVREVRALPGFRLAVTFLDGTRGIVDIAGLVRSPAAGVFESLRYLAVFDEVFIDYGAVTWPGALDLAPDAMYDEIEAQGEWKI